MTLVNAVQLLASGMLRFTKMHGLGNDYVYIDGWDADNRRFLNRDLNALARRLSDRHRGVGGDGMILVLPPENEENHACMRMFNADGSESEMCGNGLRCAAKLAYDHGHVPESGIRFETGAGVLTVDLLLDPAGVCTGARVDMGQPRLTPAGVPVDSPLPGPLIEIELEGHRLIAVGMGNPHAVCFVDDVAGVEIDQIGPRFEIDPLFPNRCNIEFVARLPDQDGTPVLRQRTWERGSGETTACGTGACAACVAAILDARIPGREAIVRLDGGDLHIDWPDDRSSVIMSGGATTVFDGVWRA